jgi:hypothetical protein
MLLMAALLMLIAAPMFDTDIELTLIKGSHTHQGADALQVDANSAVNSHRSGV